MFKLLLSLLTLLLTLLFIPAVLAQSVETENAIMADLSRRVGTTVTFNQVSGSGWTWNFGPYPYVVGLEDGCPAAPQQAPREGNWQRYTILYQGTIFKYIVSDDAQSVILCNEATIQGQIPTVAPTAIPTPTTLAPVGAVCDLPVLLVVGGRGQVTPGDPNWIHEQPVRTSAKVGEIPGGDVFDVLEGPVCDAASGVNYWRVRYGAVEGWTGEGLAGEYWAIPSGEVSINNLTVEQVAPLSSLTTIQNGHPNGVRALAFSPDGRVLATADNQHIYLWKTSAFMGSAPLTPSVTLNAAGVTKLVFSPSGKILMSLNDGLKLWSVNLVTTNSDFTVSAAELGGMGSQFKILDMVFSPDGTVMVMVTEGSITFWRMTADAVEPGESPTLIVTGLQTVTFSPDGSVLLGLDASGNIVQIWGVSGAGRG